MLRRLATASRKLVVEAIVLVVLFCLVVVEVNVRDVRRGSLEEVVLVKRGREVKDFCR